MSFVILILSCSVFLCCILNLLYLWFGLRVFMYCWVSNFSALFCQFCTRIWFFFGFWFSDFFQKFEFLGPKKNSHSDFYTSDFFRILIIGIFLRKFFFFFFFSDFLNPKFLVFENPIFCTEIRIWSCDLVWSCDRCQVATTPFCLFIFTWRRPLCRKFVIFISIQHQINKNFVIHYLSILV